MTYEQLLDKDPQLGSQHAKTQVYNAEYVKLGFTMEDEFNDDKNRNVEIQVFLNAQCINNCSPVGTRKWRLLYKLIIDQLYWKIW